MSRLMTNQQNDCAPSEDSDQPGLPTEPTAKTLKSQADVSLRWAHSHFVGFVTRWLICIPSI